MLPSVRQAFETQKIFPTGVKRLRRPHPTCGVLAPIDKTCPESRLSSLSRIAAGLRDAFLFDGVALGVHRRMVADEIVNLRPKP